MCNKLGRQRNSFGALKAKRSKRTQLVTQCAINVFFWGASWVDLSQLAATEGITRVRSGDPGWSFVIAWWGKHDCLSSTSFLKQVLKSASYGTAHSHRNLSFAYDFPLPPFAYASRTWRTRWILSTRDCDSSTQRGKTSSRILNPSYTPYSLCRSKLLLRSFRITCITRTSVGQALPATVRCY